MPTVLNAANEEAVEAFLKGKIKFLQIEDLIERAMDKHESIAHPDLEQIQEVDQLTRNFVQTLIS